MYALNVFFLFLIEEVGAKGVTEASLEKTKQKKNTAIKSD